MNFSDDSFGVGNIKNALKQFRWNLYLDRNENSNIPMNTICAYILIHLYVNHKWSFFDSRKNAICNDLIDLNLVRAVDADAGTYQITSLGRSLVHKCIPHPALTFALLFLSIIAKKSIELSVILLILFVVIKYPNSIPWLPKILGYAVTASAGICMGALCAVLLTLLIFDAYPWHLSLGLKHATKGKFVRFIAHTILTRHLLDSRIINRTLFSTSYRLSELNGTRVKNNQLLHLHFDRII